MQPSVPQVALPWGSNFWPDHRHYEASSDAHAVAASRVQAGREASATSPRTARGENVTGSSPAPRPAALLDPELQRRGLPHRPLPTLDDGDVIALDEHQLLCAAVALDVLTTWTQALAAVPTVLVTLTELLTRLAALGSEGGFGEALLQHAQSDEAGERSTLARELSACLARASAQEDPEASRSSPNSVAAALRRLERLGAIVVHDARLLVEAQQAIDYRQA